ncbi:MAG TPA: hypothetical protein VIU61_16390 [Kofleriaceae bacterium]
MLRMFALLAVACGGTTPAPAPTPGSGSAEPPEITAMLAQLDQALAQRPDDGVLLLLRAAYGSEAGRVAETLTAIEKLDAIGWDVPFAPTDFRAVHGEKRFQTAAARIAARSPRVTGSELAFTIPGPDLIPEGIAVDEASGTFFVGSIRKRAIFAIDRDRKVRTFVPARRDGLSAVLGMKVDAARGVLWATSYASEGMEGYDAKTDRGRSEVTAFALADGTRRRRAAFPAGGDQHLLNDIAIASDGTLYVTDSVAGAVWRVPPDRDELEKVLAPGSLAYPNGIVLAPSGKLLVAHGTGIAIVDPATGTLERMTSPPRTPLGGIDGLLLRGRTLLAVQNGLGVPRLVAIALDESGTKATSLTVLENDAALLPLPTTAALYENALYTIANAQLDAIGPKGLDATKQLRDPQIVRTKIP